jgi:class 3 adenylate cyclase
VTPDGKNALAVLIADLKLNTFLLADADGRIVFGRGYDEETQALTSPPRGLFPHLTPDNPLLRHPNAESSLTGLVFIPEGPLLVASEYILSSQGGGILGTVIMGRFLDDEEIRQLSELTRLSLVVHRLDGSDMPEDFQDALSTVSDETPVAVRTLDDNLVAGYTVLPDIQGEPGMIMRVDVPRDIMDKGRLSMLYLLISLVAVGLVMVALILFLLDKLVLSRLLRLGGEVSGIQSASDLALRVSVTGQDELSSTSGAINVMLDGLEQAHQELSAERERSESLLLNVLPEPIADRLKDGETTIADQFDEVTVMFADIVGFTPYSAGVSPTELVDMLNRLFSEFDELTELYGLEKIKTIGDAYMVAAGLPSPRPDHAEAIADMALDAQQMIGRFSDQQKIPLKVRLGINTGPVVAGVIGTKKFIYDLWGDTVNTAARMQTYGVEGAIQVSQETYQRLRDKYNFEDRGLIEMKGKGEVAAYLLTGKIAAVEQTAALEPQGPAPDETA